MKSPVIIPKNKSVVIQDINEVADAIKEDVKDALKKKAINQ